MIEYTIVPNGHRPPTEMDLIAALHANLAKLERHLIDSVKPPICPYIPIFTRRENELLQAIVECATEHGHTQRGAIGERLNITERTVQTHLSEMFDKAGAHDKAALILWAMRQGGTNE